MRAEDGPLKRLAPTTAHCSLLSAAVVDHFVLSGCNCKPCCESVIMAAETIFCKPAAVVAKRKISPIQIRATIRGASSNATPKSAELHRVSCHCHCPCSLSIKRPTEAAKSGAEIGHPCSSPSVRASRPVVCPWGEQACGVSLEM